MRQLLAHLAVYVLAAGLVVGSLLFAWLRSEQLVISSERAVEPPEYASAVDPAMFEWEDFGERTYAANCANCHGGDGTGFDVYPPVQGLAETAATDEGRAYLTHLVLFGLATGDHPAPMPPMPHLSDAQIAAVNNFIITRFDDHERVEDLQLYVPRDVATERRGRED